VRASPDPAGTQHPGRADVVPLQLQDEIEKGVVEGYLPGYVCGKIAPDGWTYIQTRKEPT
jgi:hypothetical protein